MTRKDFVNYRLDRAQQSFKVAAKLIDEEFYEDAVNRIYYTVFYAVSALLYQKNLYPKTHLGAKALVNKEFFQTGLFNKEHTEFYNTIFAKRFEVDYEDFVDMEAAEVKKYLLQAQKFLKSINEYIDNQSAEE